jgi:hypothetical protein
MEESKMEHKERYKSIQINLSLEKHKELIEWLDDKADEEETSYNSVVIRALKNEKAREKKVK